MKTISSRTLLRFLIAASLTAFALTRAHADDEGSTAKVTLSAPAKPATLRIDMPWADIHIVGVDGNVVTVESTISQKDAKSTRSDGLRRLDDEVTFELTEKDNTVSLRIAGDNPWANHDAEFKISVPRAMALDVKTEAGGDLTVKDITGDIEINNMNGEIMLEGITGSAVVNTMNGEVRAIYAKAPQKLVSITSMNGEIDLRVPADTKANVRLRTHNGSIMTDFDEAVLKTKSEGRSAGSGNSYGSEAGRNAAEAVRMAMQVARDVAQEVSREVKREVERAHKEAAESAVAAHEQAVELNHKELAERDANPHAAPLAEPSAPHAPRSPRPPMPPITGGKIVSGTLNGGGVDIKISTMNGEITLRQTK